MLRVPRTQYDNHLCLPCRYSTGNYCPTTCVCHYVCTNSLSSLTSLITLIKGWSFAVYTAYNEIISFAIGTILLLRIIKLYGMRNKFKKAWDATGPVYMTSCLCSYLTCFMGIDLDGMYGIFPKAMSHFLYECRIGLGFAIAQIIIFQWIAIINAKGASADLPTHFKVLRAIVITVCILVAIVLPILEVTAVPAGSAVGVINARMSVAKYLIASLLSLFTSLLSTVYGYKIYSAMGGDAAITKARTQSASGSESSKQDLAKLQAVKKVVYNIMMISLFFLIAFMYALNLTIQRISSCYMYEEPGTFYIFSLVNTLIIAGPGVVLLLMAMPGEKSTAKKILDTASTAVSKMAGRKSKAGGATSVLDSNASTMESKAAKSAAFDRSERESAVSGREV